MKVRCDYCRQMIDEGLQLADQKSHNTAYNTPFTFSLKRL